MSKLLNENEITEILCRAEYWNDEPIRDNENILNKELIDLVSYYGTSLLFILEDYAKRIKDEQNIKILSMTPDGVNFTLENHK